MVTRILAVVSALLAALVIHQYSQIGQLRAEVANAEERGGLRARASVVDSLSTQGEEIQRTMSWLNDYYKSSEGLQRANGLWIHEHPDWEGLSVWVFSVYLPHRLKGENEDQARQAVVDAIKQSEEWQVKHRG
jgi:hypothetical protein